jgi:hypothetical protein
MKISSRPWLKLEITRDIFLISKTPRLWTPLSLPVIGFGGTSCLDKTAGPWIWQLISGAEVRNEWSYACNPLCLCPQYWMFFWCCKLLLDFTDSIKVWSSLDIYRVYTKEWCGFKSLQEIYFSPYTGTTYTVSSGNCPSFSYVNHNPSMCAPWVTRHTSTR